MEEAIIHYLCIGAFFGAMVGGGLALAGVDSCGLLGCWYAFTFIYGACFGLPVGCAIGGIIWSIVTPGPYDHLGIKNKDQSKDDESGEQQ